jgi:AcrR family transcriptional regulator
MNFTANSKTKTASDKNTEENAGSLAAHWGQREDVPLELRHRLYPAVFEAFANDDYNRVGIRELSRLTGISSATIYKYFESKEVLLTSVCGALFPFIAEEMSKCVSVDKPADQNFRSLYAWLFGFYDDTPSLPTVFFVTVPSKLWMQSGGWRAKEVVPVFKLVLEAGQRRGQLDSELTVSTVMGLFYMHIQHEVLLWYLEGKRWRLTERIHAFFPYFWRSVASKGDQSRTRKPTRRTGPRSTQLEARAPVESTRKSA